MLIFYFLLLIFVAIANGFAPTNGGKGGKNKVYYMESIQCNLCFCYLGRCKLYIYQLYTIESFWKKNTNIKLLYKKCNQQTTYVIHVSAIKRYDSFSGAFMLHAEKYNLSLLIDEVIIPSYL